MMNETSVSERIKNFHIGCCFKPHSSAVSLQKEREGKYFRPFYHDPLDLKSDIFF